MLDNLDLTLFYHFVTFIRISKHFLVFILNVFIEHNLFMLVQILSGY